MKQISPKLERNLKIVVLENLNVKPGDSFESKMNIPGIDEYVLRLKIPGFTKNQIKTGWKHSGKALNVSLENIFETTASLYAHKGNLEKLNPFVKRLDEINRVEISFNDLHVLTKCDSEFTGAFLSEETFSAIVANIGSSTRILRTLLCGNEKTKITKVRQLHFFII